MNKKFPCPCCGYLVWDTDEGTFEICDICHWQDDPLQNRRPDYSGGANRVSLNQARLNFKRLGVSEEAFLGKGRKPLLTELPNLPDFDYAREVIDSHYKEGEIVDIALPFIRDDVVFAESEDPEVAIPLEKTEAEITRDVLSVVEFLISTGDFEVCEAVGLGDGKFQTVSYKDRFEDFRSLFEERLKRYKVGDNICDDFYSPDLVLIKVNKGAMPPKEIPLEVLQVIGGYRQ